MVAINLLPWRQYKQNYQNKLIKKCLFTIIFIILLSLIGIHEIISIKEKNVQTRIELLQKQIDHYQKQFMKHSPVFKDANNGTKSSSTSTTQISPLFFELGKRNTEGEVCFTEIIRNKQTTTFVGNARSTADITYYLKNWNAAHLFSQIIINQLNQQQAFVRFRFQAN